MSVSFNNSNYNFWKIVKVLSFASSGCLYLELDTELSEEMSSLLVCLQSCFQMFLELQYRLVEELCIYRRILDTYRTQSNLAHLK